MYIYFDSNGTIKEIVNDVAIRKGSVDYNKLYVYIEGEPEIDDIWYFQKFPNGSTSNEVSFVDDVVTKAIPYDAKRDMAYFKDFVQYKFYVFTLTSEYLNISGLAIGTIRIAIDNSIFALGELTFNIQANEVKEDNNITQSQYDYLLLAYASRTLSEQTGSDLQEVIDDIINAKVEELNPLQPSGTGTTAYITSQTSDIGILISTDNGHWYYWNGTQYADGGNYQAPFYNSSNKLNADYVDDTNSTHKFVTAEQRTQIGTNATNIANNTIAIANRYTKTEVDTALNLKADKSTTYTKTEVDTALNLKADKATTYTKTEVDNKIDDISAYSKSEIDTMLNAKADASDVTALDLEVDGLANDITDLKAVQNVVDVVATKSALDSYVTTKLETNDKIQVIADETHDGASTIYNWTGSVWSYVGAFGGNAYTKTQVDTLLGAKADLNNSSQNFVARTATANSLIANTGLVVGSALSTEGYVGIAKDENSDKYQLLRYKSGTTTKIDIPEATGTMALTSDITTAVSTKQDIIDGSNKLSSAYVDDVNYIALSKTITSFSDVTSVDATGYLTQAEYDRIDDNTRIDFTITATNDNTAMIFRLKVLYSDSNGYTFGTYQFFENSGIVYETMMNCYVSHTNYSYEMHFTVLQLYTKGSVDTLLSSKSTVVANPTLDGTESDLTGLEVNGVKYAVPQGSGGGSLYLHMVQFTISGSNKYNFVFIELYSNSSTPYVYNDLVSMGINNIPCCSNMAGNNSGYIALRFGALSSELFLAGVYISNGALNQDFERVNVATNVTLTDTVTQV